MANPPNIPRTPGRHEDEVFMNASGPWSGVRATSICFSIVDSSPVGAIVVSGEPPGGLQSTALLFIRITLKIAVSLLETEGRKLHRMTRVHGNNSALLWGLSPVCACGPAVRSIDIDSGGDTPDTRHPAAKRNFNLIACRLTFRYYPVMNMPSMTRSGVFGGCTGELVIAPLGAIFNVIPVNPGYLNGFYSIPLAQPYRPSAGTLLQITHYGSHNFRYVGALPQ